MSMHTTQDEAGTNNPQNETRNNGNPPNEAENTPTSNTADYGTDLMDQLLQTGKLRFESGDHEGAADAFRQMVALNRNAFAAWNNLGVTMHVLRKWDEAVEAFAHALALQPTHPDVRHNLRTLLLATDHSGRASADVLIKFGEAMHRAGRVADAHEQFALALQSDPTNAEAWNDLGVTHFQQGRLDEALGAFSRSVELNPGDINAINNYAKMLYASGETMAARDQLLAAMRLDPADAPTRTNLVETGTMTEDEIQAEAERIQILGAIDILQQYSPEDLAAAGWTLAPIAG